MRPVIDLRPLNKYLSKLHFKMDTLYKVLDLVQTGDWGLTLDLKDAYFHIKVFKKQRKYLRFCFQNQVYQFRALCFGPTVSPRVFTKVIAVVTAHLHCQNIRLAERSGSVVECLTRDRRVAGSSLTGVTALWSLSKTHLS